MTALAATTFKNTLTMPVIDHINSIPKVLAAWNGITNVNWIAFNVSSNIDGGVGVATINFTAFFSTTMPVGDGGSHDVGVSWMYVTMTVAPSAAVFVTTWISAPSAAWKDASYNGLRAMGPLA